MDPLRQALKKKKSSESREDKQAEQLLRAYLKQDAMNLFQIKIFQSSQRNVLENLPKQVSFISKQVAQHFNLAEAYARTQSGKSATEMAEKMQNW